MTKFLQAKILCVESKQQKSQYSRPGSTLNISLVTLLAFQVLLVYHVLAHDAQIVNNSGYSTCFGTEVKWSN
jgi:hypothetical protein